MGSLSVLAILEYNGAGMCNSSGYDYVRLMSCLEDTLKNPAVYRRKKVMS